MWESNPPEKLLTPQTGFEDRKAHQHPSTPISCINMDVIKKGRNFFVILSFFLLFSVVLLSKPHSCLFKEFYVVPTLILII